MNVSSIPKFLSYSRCSVNVVSLTNSSMKCLQEFHLPGTFLRKQKTGIGRWWVMCFLDTCVLVEQGEGCPSLMDTSQVMRVSIHRTGSISGSQGDSLGPGGLVTPGECPCPWLGQAENISNVGGHVPPTPLISPSLSCGFALGSALTAHLPHGSVVDSSQSY